MSHFIVALLCKEIFTGCFGAVILSQCDNFGVSLMRVTSPSVVALFFKEGIGGCLGVVVTFGVSSMQVTLLWLTFSRRGLWVRLGL